MPSRPQDSTHPARARDATSTRVLERLRGICLALPEANERTSHGEPTWFAGKGKVFAMFDDHHHGAEHVAVWLPMPRGAQEALIEAEPARHFRPPYVGPAGWVGVVLDRTPDWAEVAILVRDAYLHVATAKLRALASGGGTAPDAPDRCAATRGPAAPSRASSTWVALLRGINLGAQRRLPMAAAREAFEAAGASDVKTYIQSGNVVFTHPLADEAALARRLERALGEVAGFEVQVVLRDAAEMAAALARCPFPSVDAGSLHVTFLAEPPPAGWMRQLDRAAFTPEEAKLVGRDLHVHLPGGMGRSKLASALAKVGGPAGTVRNRRTVEALVGMLGGATDAASPKRRAAARTPR